MRLRLNGWQRLGVVVSAAWALFATVVVLDRYMDATNGRWSVYFTNAPGRSGGWDVVEQRPITPKDRVPSASDPIAGEAPRNAAVDELLALPKNDPNPSLRGGGRPAESVTWPNDPVAAHGNSIASAGSFDDLVPKRNAFDDLPDETKIIPVWGSIFGIIFVPIIVLWIAAYVLVFAVRWVISGFRGG